MSINRVNISGNLTRDAEYKQTQGGTAVLNFGVAVNDRAKNQQTGEWEDRPNFVDCVTFGNRAQALSSILRKGMKVAVEGKLRWSQWTDRDTGKKRSKLEVVADEIELMTARDQQGQPQQAAQPQQAPTYQQPAQTYQQTAPAPAYAPQPAQTYQQPQQPQYAPQTAYQQPQAAPAPTPAPQPAQQQMPMPQQPVDVYDEDIPF